MKLSDKAWLISLTSAMIGTCAIVFIDSWVWLKPIAVLALWNAYYAARYTGSIRAYEEYGKKVTEMEKKIIKQQHPHIEN